MTVEISPHRTFARHSSSSFGAGGCLTGARKKKKKRKKERNLAAKLSRLHGHHVELGIGVSLYFGQLLYQKKNREISRKWKC